MTGGGVVCHNDDHDNGKDNKDNDDNDDGSVTQISYFASLRQRGRKSLSESKFLLSGCAKHGSL